MLSAFVWVTTFYSILCKPFHPYFPKHTIPFEPAVLKAKSLHEFCAFTTAKELVEMFA